MKVEQAAVGMRVRYTGKEPWSARRASGTLVKIYPAYSGYDPEDGEWFEREARPVVQVDQRPDWWPYNDTDRFCPVFDELEAE